MVAGNGTAWETRRRRALGLMSALACFLVCPAVALAQAAEPATPDMAETLARDALFTVNNVWMMTATCLVFIMHLGFASVESGLTQAKNTVNVLFKNTVIPCIGLLTYALCGFALMYPGEFNLVPGGILGFAGLGVGLPEAYVPIDYAGGAYTYWTDFLFQAMFAATAATIVSGAVAERVKLLPFLLFTTVYVGFVYPVIGSWQWGKGFLYTAGFYDFAGSTLVHSVGGWGALAFVLLLGPRSGKYYGGVTRAIEGHSMPLATIGVFLLWLGWFGFNGGSVLSANPELVSYVLVITCLGAAAGAMGATVTSWSVNHKPDFSMVLNGILAGLVGITAGADCISVPEAILIGGVAGIVVVFAVQLLDLLHIDDPVGAIPVHLVCGVWGTLAVGLFGEGHQLLPQLLGIVVVGGASFVSAGLIALALKLTTGIRVSRDEEAMGLDIGEHGMEAYGGFQIFASK